MKRDITVIRASTQFVRDCLDIIIEDEKKRGREFTSYATATDILRTRILAAGGLKK